MDVSFPCPELQLWAVTKDLQPPLIARGFLVTRHTVILLLA
jgi:hypothetical protein